MINLRTLSVGLALSALGLALAPAASAAPWYVPRVEFGFGSANPSPLAEFVRCRDR